MSPPPRTFRRFCENYILSTFHAGECTADYDSTFTHDQIDPLILLHSKDGEESYTNVSEHSFATLIATLDAPNTITKIFTPNGKAISCRKIAFAGAC